MLNLDLRSSCKCALVYKHLRYSTEMPKFYQNDLAVRNTAEVTIWWYVVVSPSPSNRRPSQVQVPLILLLTTSMEEKKSCIL
jgi:hypothetical protein